ncbi:hypothetical protein V6V47_06830 [Micromonospora sp. CPCC 205539]|uniref:hypothetical protein n=1 Tax=Micromonospora sp. CPCC 205539 TaxID=3122408 RepID=UPI002FEF456D
MANGQDLGRAAPGRRPIGWTRAAGAGYATGGTALDAARTASSGPWPALPDDPSWPTQSAGAAAGGERAAVTSDLWPALPDDRPLWSVPDAALDATELGRLDREQAGD